jgi:tetratricopeptide (TPR) repeat protein
MIHVGLILWLSVASPPTDRVLNLGDRLLSAGLVEEAVTEYKRYIFFNSDRPDSETGYAYGQIAVGYRSQGRYDEAVAMLLEAIQAETRDELRDERRVDLGVTQIASGRYDLADFTLLKIEMFSPFAAAKNRASFFRGICNLYTGHWDEARIAFRSYAGGTDPDAQEFGSRIERILVAGHGQKLKSTRLAKALSTVIPGLGEMYASDWKGGVKTLVVNAATGSLVVRDVVRHRALDAVFDTNLIFMRFYGGSRDRAVAAANRHNENLGLALVSEVFNIVERK